MHDPELHVGEDAELYALGELDELSRVRIERHAATCASCLRALGDAEATVLRLIENDAMPGERPARLDRRIAFPPRGAWRAPWIAAVAAAFVVGLLPWGATFFVHGTGDQAAQTQLAATDAMLHGHFLHAQFAARTAGAPAAKAIYARDGSWIYVIVDAGQDSLKVALVTNGAATVEAAIPASQSARTAFLRPAGKVEKVELLDRSGATVAEANLATAR